LFENDRHHHAHIGGAGSVDTSQASLQLCMSAAAEAAHGEPLRRVTRGSRITLDQRRRLERDLHDAVQTELVGLIVKLASAELDPRTPPAVADMLGGLQTRAQAALDSLRSIVGGIYPRVLADFGVERALRAHAARAAIDVRLRGRAPRSTEDAELAVYFSCLEAIQNTVKHAGPAVVIELWLRYSRGRLRVYIADDGLGFDPARPSSGTGLGNIRDRIEELGGTFSVSSGPGCGTALTIALPWPARTEPE
jgi:signal transduction histidine kinase